MNRLQHETSPYLLQHQDNPVDWYPWGQEALDAARTTDKPILLSIGYSSCHWCHVMAHESFEDPATAALMNEHFINIKVDREERPDLDDIYMQATLMFTEGHGGWPMTVFLTPDGRPFHAGTYFPPTPRHGMPSFSQVLLAASDAYRNRRTQLEEMASQVAEYLQQNMGAPDNLSVVKLDAELLAVAVEKLLHPMDTEYGGLHTGQPKFPSPLVLDFLLYNHAHQPDRKLITLVLHTLQKMALGGIYDQFGGGFHRYSVDRRWLVPHFEKMLYDNALLVRVYLHAYQITQDPFFADIAQDILRYVTREMLDSSGGFYSSQDADSEGEEGKFYVWSLDEITDILTGHLSADEIEAFVDVYDISEDGNFEGHNIPNMPTDLQQIATTHHLSLERLQEIIQTAKPLLFEHRSKRIKPSRDEKMLAAWNGMMLAAFAEAARILDNPDYLTIAEKNADFILRELITPIGRLYRTHKRQGQGGESKIDAYLEDYAAVIEGLLELYQSNFNPHYFTVAQSLADHVLAHFSTGHQNGFYDTSDEHETLITRPRNMQDNATPAGNNHMAYTLIKLAAFTGQNKYEEAAFRVLNQLTAAMREYPSAFGMALSGLYLAVHRVVELAIIGNPAEEATQNLLNIAQKPFNPRLITALSPQDAPEEATPPLLAYRIQRHQLPTAYVCQNFICAAPVNSPAELENLLTAQ